MSFASKFFQVKIIIKTMKKFVLALIVGKVVLFSILAALIVPSSQIGGSAQTQTTPSSSATPVTTNDNINRPVSEPYTGDLSIFEGEERAKNLQIDRVMDILNIKEGKSVADLGAGSGWFTVRAAKRVGETGKVFAIEINPDSIKHINDRAKNENLPNIQTVLGTEDDPKLANNSVDAVLILKTYHEIAQPVKVLQNLKKALKKDALIGIIDRNGKGDDHGIDKEKVIEEASRAGFVLKEEFDFTKADGMDYFLVFQAEK
jgi:SAM-dependent methyltransferase